jgi:YegS/Rv2252/BmrU family lipid kinase
MKKMLFVMNPFAGTRKANKVLTEILCIFSEAGYDVHVYMTQSQGDGKRKVRSCAGEMDLVVCCGGDGTFNETVAGVMESGVDVPVGYIPGGSTNDFAGSLGLSLDPVEAARQIVSGTVQQYDVGCFGGRYFSYIASFGAFTKTSYATPQGIKNSLGALAYFLEGISELSQLRSLHARFEAPDQVVEDDFLFAAVCNSTSLGGIFTLDPKQVDMSDGKFEVLLVRAPKDIMEIGECIQAVQKQKYNCRMITFFSTDKLQVEADPDMPWTLDGEREDGHAQVQISNIHHAIKIVK